MTAVNNDDVRTVRDIEITRPGPRLPVGLRNLAGVIRPGRHAAGRALTRMAAGTLAPDLRSGGVAAWVRGRPVVVGVVATILLVVSMVLGVGLGSVQIGPSRALA